MNDPREPIGDGAGAAPEEGDLIARLLRLAGPRPEAPAGAGERVRAIVHARWRESVAVRRRRRSLLWLAASAAAAAAVVTAGLGLRRGGAAPAGPAGAGTAGTLILRVGDVRGPDGAPLSPGAAIAPGAALETDASSRAAVRLAGGAAVRMDTSTRVTLRGGSVLEIDRGAVYADSGGAAGRDGALEVRTPLGDIRDVGTRFEVRVGERGVRVRVRQGAVIVEAGRTAREVPRATQITLDEAGGAATAAIPIHGPEWHWILDVSPEFDLEGRTLGEFLEWVSSETGLRVAFAAGVREREAREIVLHGPAAGLKPDRAPEAVLPTCGLSHRVEGDALVIFPAAAEEIRE